MRNADAAGLKSRPISDGRPAIAERAPGQVIPWRGGFSFVEGAHNVEHAAQQGAIMCGRYALYGPKSRLYEQFDPGFQEIDDRPGNPFDRYNIAPSQSAPVVRGTADGKREVLEAQWGLLPSWVKEPGKLSKPINARLETVAEKPMFRQAFRKSRVLVPASGFYEWQPVPGGKQAYFIRPVGVAFFGFAGLLEHWNGPDGAVTTFAIVVTAANDLMRPIHDRMPVIIPPEDYATWLDPSVTDAAIVRELTGEYPPELMEAYRVGRAVGNPRNDGPELIQTLAEGQ